MRALNHAFAAHDPADDALESVAETADKLTRSKSEGSVSPKVVAAVFHTAKDAFGAAESDQPGDWIVFRVTDVTTPKFDANSPDTKRMEDTVKRQESQEIYDEYVASVENELGTTINQAALAQALGNSAPDSN